MWSNISSYSLFPVLLVVGWIAGCITVVYFVFIFAWV
ncbi:sarcoplasmic/endoplasmic reticulum calcium ATPase regulator DWORF-like [Melanotaenia boesemani]|nr:sarcoplasmic/endoplasmic reticulum calcium ATPase regulator DWORF-like [Melanotaenia boesemani]